MRLLAVCSCAIVSWLVLILVYAAVAQPAKNTASNRLSASLGQCIGLLEERNDQVFDLQKQVDETKAEVKRLKEKYEPEEKK